VHRWVNGELSGAKSSYFCGTDAELEFVRDHVQSKVSCGQWRLR
jgi:hypothetical protein